ncbi:hypothetical protein [Methylocystis sp. B8]|uniref:COG4223 family protein n=1 Tax=Methylocystis sp. B8 TaxID=544938 RepID=UPI0010FF076B|nr:hypothetical protein [Methylocystis sp. B8]TLG76870.1 hypothetical protein FEV16_09000 [Methylocystis sp. B8]
MVSPDDEEPNRVEYSEAPLEPAEIPPEPPPAPVIRKRRRSVLLPLLSTLLLLILLAGAALYAAIAFKDKDERLKAVADYAEPYVDQASSAFGDLQERARSLFGEAGPTRTTEIAPEAQPSAPPAAQQVAPQKPADRAVEPLPQETRSEPTTNAAVESQKAAVVALQGRVDSTEDTAQRALRAAEAAEAAANAARVAAEAATKTSLATTPAESGQEGALTVSEQVTALEGRIDELGDEIKALRERLEAPKSETRAAPEASAAKTAEGPASVVVIAYALQRELEAGRPYAVEIKALTRLGGDQAALAALTPFAEKGAPTATQLKADFAPAAKRIRALESGDSGDLAQHLMKGASKLVRVRPSGQAPTTEAQTVEEKVAHIEAALDHGDLAQANALFSALPEAAQNEAKDFGATLRARIDAGKAADDLLHGAIAALGATKE